MRRMDIELLQTTVAAIPEGRWATYIDLCTAAGGTRAHARSLNGRMTRGAWDGAHRVLNHGAGGDQAGRGQRVL